MESIMATQAIAPTAFFYYTPDENRQHGHFTSHPGFQPSHNQIQHLHHMHNYHQQQSRAMTVLPVVPVLPSTPIFSRPGSPSSQTRVCQKIFTGLPSSLTPLASPQPLAHKPAIMVDTEFSSDSDCFYPSTPPLSSSGSVSSSPGSGDLLQTPMNPMFSGIENKETSNTSGQLEQFPTIDWTNCVSPPLTPVYIQSQIPKTLSLDSTGELPSISSCPSLSPSPPYARSISSDDVDFCDPRNLTVGSSNSNHTLEAVAVPTIYSSDEKQSKLLVQQTVSSPGSPSQSFESFMLETPQVYGQFEEFSDLDSQDNFVHRLINLGSGAKLQSVRSRASSDAFSIGQSSCSYEEDPADFDTCESFSIPSSPDSCGDLDDHKDKKQRTSEVLVMKANADTGSGQPPEQRTPTAADNSQCDNRGSLNTSSESTSSPNDNGNQNSQHEPASRRGRKQSLTEDPSKQFVCDLCNRRFRRQEHLKRHYRSLHTREKPFECNECGKKFSRSDNLAQHARTHGSGAIVMNLIDDPDAVAAAGVPPGFSHHMIASTGLASDAGRALSIDDDYHQFGKVLFQVTAELPGSSTELSSDEGSDHTSRKKRKRAD